MRKIGLKPNKTLLDKFLTIGYAGTGKSTFVACA